MKRGKAFRVSEEQKTAGMIDGIKVLGCFCDHQIVQAQAGSFNGIRVGINEFSGGFQESVKIRLLEKVFVKGNAISPDAEKDRQKTQIPKRIGLRACIGQTAISWFR